MKSLRRFPGAFFYSFILKVIENELMKFMSEYNLYSSTMFVFHFSSFKSPYFDQYLCLINIYIISIMFN